MQVIFLDFLQKIVKYLGSGASILGFAVLFIVFPSIANAAFGDTHGGPTNLWDVQPTMTFTNADGELSFTSSGDPKSTWVRTMFEFPPSSSNLSFTVEYTLTSNSGANCTLYEASFSDPNVGNEGTIDSTTSSVTDIFTGTTPTQTITGLGLFGNTVTSWDCEVTFSSIDIDSTELVEPLSEPEDPLTFEDVDFTTFYDIDGLNPQTPETIVPIPVIKDGDEYTIQWSSFTPSSYTSVSYSPYWIDLETFKIEEAKFSYGDPVCYGSGTGGPYPSDVIIDISTDCYHLDSQSSEYSMYFYIIRTDEAWYVPSRVNFDPSGDYLSTTNDPTLNTISRIVEMSPDQSSVNATSTDFALDVDIYTNSEDYEEGTELKVTFYRQSNSQLVGASNAIIGTAPNSGLYEIPVTNSGVFTFSTTTSILEIGDYWYTAEIVFPDTFWESVVNFFSFSSNFNESGLKKSVIFTVVEQLGIDQLYSDPDYIVTSGAFGNFIENLDVDSCSIISGDFSVLECLKLLIIPPQSTLSAVWESLVNNTLQVFPLGYITRFLSIATGSAAAIPPPLQYTYGTSAPNELQGLSVSFQIWNSFTTLESIKADDGSDKNIWDITMPYFDLIIGLGVLGVILADVLRLGLPDFGAAFGSRSRNVNPASPNRPLVDPRTGMTIDMRKQYPKSTIDMRKK